jgi:mannosyltransferase OCH1-like enzyme
LESGGIYLTQKNVTPRLKPEIAMFSKTTYAAATLLVICSAATAQAQQHQALTDSLAQNLKQLTMQQEIYYSQHNTYTSDVKQLHGLPTTVHFTITSKDLLHGYVAEAVDPTLKGRSCVVMMGKPGVSDVTTRRGKAVTQAGRLICDGGE